MNYQFMTFFIEDEVFGIDILCVKEINESFEVTPVPLARPHVLGLINLRGQIVTLLDLPKALGYENCRIKDTSLIILKTNQELSPVALNRQLVTHSDSVGFRVDAIGNVVTCSDAAIQSPPANTSERVAEVLMGVVAQESRLVGILSLEKLLDRM